MEKDPIAQAARLSGDMATAGFDRWRELLEQFGERRQELVRQLLAGQAQLAQFGDDADRGATIADWQAYYQDNVRRGIELSAGAWDAVYSTQSNLLQVCEQLAVEQGRLLEQSLNLIFGSAALRPPVRLEAPAALGEAKSTASDAGERDGTASGTRAARDY